MTDNLKYELGQFRILEKKLFDAKGEKNNKVITGEELKLMVELINQLEDELRYTESFLNR